MTFGFDIIKDVFSAGYRVYEDFFRAGHYRDILVERFGFNSDQAGLFAYIIVTLNVAFATAFGGFLLLLGRGELTLKQAAYGLLGFAAFGFVPVVTQKAYEAFPQHSCFSQKNGDPIKWYVVRSSQYILSDDPGFDPVDGTPKQPVTADICRAYDRQRAGVASSPLSNTEALDAVQAGLWFYRREGRLYIFMAQIPIPGTRELTKPITPEVIAEIKANAAEEKRLADEELAKQQAVQLAEAEQARRNQLLPLQTELQSVPGRYKCILQNDGLKLDVSFKEAVSFDKLSVTVEDAELEDKGSGEKQLVRSVKVLGPDIATNERQQCLAAVVPIAGGISSTELARLRTVIQTLQDLNVKVSVSPELVSADPAAPLSYAPTGAAGSSEAPNPLNGFVRRVLNPDPSPVGPVFVGPTFQRGAPAAHRWNPSMRAAPAGGRR